jgi:asparagine synthase (glutamine-hydrolysing)
MIGAVLGRDSLTSQKKFSTLGCTVISASAGRACVFASQSSTIDQLAKTASSGWPRSGEHVGQTVAGDFARIVANDREELVLTRGQFGGRPLYYALAADAGSVLACSDLTPLVAALGQVDVDLERLAARLLGKAHRDRSRTFYRQIQRVPSAATLTIGTDGVRSHEDIPFEIKPALTDSVDDLALEIRRVIRAAVRRVIGSADDVGVVVSGGLDSSALLATAVDVARTAAGPRVRAFNLCFEGPGDDRPHLAKVCHDLGILPERVAPRDCAWALPASLVVDSAPLGWPVSAFDIVLTRMGRDRGTKVLISGVAGDELFNGDLQIFADRARRGHLASAIYSAAILRGWGRSSVQTRLRALVLSPVLKSLLPRTLRRRAHRLRRVNQWAGPQLRKLMTQGAFEDAPRQAPEMNRLDVLSRSADFLDYSEARAQIELIGGCTRADPYLDPEVVSLVASIEPELLFHGGRVRGLFRHALGGVIPESVRLRPDKARFEPALLELVQAGGGFAAFDPLVRMTALADFGLVAPGAFRRRFDELARTPLNGHLWMELWPALAAEAFARRF